MNRTIIKAVIFGMIFSGVFLSPTSAVDEKATASGSTTRPNVSVTISCDKKVIKAGDEIQITFVIKNNGETGCPYMKVEPGSRMDEYKLTAVGPDGKPAIDPLAVQTEIREGIAGGGILAPGESFTKVVSLNLWALVLKPGKYRVSGVFYPSNISNPQRENYSTASPSIEITIQPRTDQEMAAYINLLSKQFSTSAAENDETMQKLAFTCDPRIVPILIDAVYDHPDGNMGYWTDKAIEDYLPKDNQVRDQLLKAATERGLANGMSYAMRAAGCSRDEIKKAIGVSLSVDHPGSWAAGALEAQTNCDDSFTPRLIALATMPGANASNGGVQAIYALAFNRTDESVATLKKLLADQTRLPLSSRTISQVAAEAIRFAYLSRGISDGRKLQPDDFGLEYQTLSPPK